MSFGGSPIAKSGGWLFTRRVSLEFIPHTAGQVLSRETLTLGERRIPLAFVRNLRARRYVLRLRPDGSARITIPRGGSVAEARRFAERKADWIEKTMERLAARPIRPQAWRIGDRIHFRGELVTIEAGGNGREGWIRFGTETVRVADPSTDLRPAIERHLWGLAARELPCRVLECAAAHGLRVRRVTVRNQRSRWGSCSARGTISLNWRLIQAPEFVQNYLIVHELMHLRQMNHSARFWREVENACPNYRVAERWLKEHYLLLT